MIPKSRKQNFEKLKNTHPDLYLFLKNKYPKLSLDELGSHAGDIIEWVIISGGNVDVFLDAIIDQSDLDYTEDEEE